MPELKDLEVAFRSATPIIVIETLEETRAIELFTRFGMKLNSVIFRWSATEGLKRAETAASTAIMNTDAPNDVLRHIKMTSQEGQYLLLDFHPYLSDPITIRYIKDVALGFSQIKRRLILLSHAVDIPEELSVWCMRFHLHLPDTNTLLSIISEEARRWQGETGTRPKADRKAVKQIATNLNGVTTTDARRLIRQAITDDGAITKRDVRTVQQAKYQLLNQDGIIQYEADTAAFADIAGLANMKKWLETRKAALADSSSQKDAPKGIMLLGVQGSGKSLAAKTVAGQFGLPLLRLDIAGLYNKYIGETEKNLRKALSIADMMSPCVVWIDEIEKAISSDGNDQGVSTRILGTMLTWMSETNLGSFIVATANDIERLPPELVRKGRLDEIFFVDLPDQNVRKDIFAIHLRKRNLAPSAFDLDKLAEISENYNGAEIEQVVISAIYSADARSQTPDTDILVEEIYRTQPLAVVMAEKIDYLRSWAKDRTVPAH